MTGKKKQAKRGKKADQSGNKKKTTATGSGTKSKGKASGSKRSKGKSGKLVGDGDMEIRDDNGLFSEFPLCLLRLELVSENRSGRLMRRSVLRRRSDEPGYPHPASLGRVVDQLSEHGRR